MHSTRGSKQSGRGSKQCAWIWESPNTYLNNVKRSTENPTVGAVSSACFFGCNRFTKVVFPEFARPSTNTKRCGTIRTMELVSRVSYGCMVCRYSTNSRHGRPITNSLRKTLTIFHRRKRAHPFFHPHVGPSPSSSLLPVAVRTTYLLPRETKRHHQPFPQPHHDVSGSRTHTRRVRAARSRVAPKRDGLVNQATLEIISAVSRLQKGGDALGRASLRASAHGRVSLFTARDGRRSQGRQASPTRRGTFFYD